MTIVLTEEIRFEFLLLLIFPAFKIYEKSNSLIVLHNLIFVSYLKKQRDYCDAVCYDIKYALRLCLGDGNEYTNHILHRACVIIYTELKLYEEAVMMALKVCVCTSLHFRLRQIKRK